LAIFDLDNTLIAGDSDYLWGQFLVKKGLVDGPRYEEANKRFYEEYLSGTLDIYAFLEFSLKPLAEHPTKELLRWREQFIAQEIRPILLPAAQALVAKHRDRGDALLIITATNRFVTEPIARLLGVDELLASEPETVNGRYTGGIVGIPTYREGKIAALEQWLGKHRLGLAESWFYSDSHNDIPLLERVTHPVAVDADDALAAYAREKGWPQLSLRDTAR